jgi:DNA-binding NarL/FixJ family response regulator
LNLNLAKTTTSWQICQEGSKMPFTILLVEDHEAVRHALRDWFAAEFPCSRIIGASDGEAALALVDSMTPDVIVMDVGLPGMSGIEAVGRIKAQLPDTRVVMLSIHEDRVYRDAASAAGASAYVTKRAMHTDLLPAVNALLAIEEGEPPG